MPLYTFQSGKTIKDFLFSMNEVVSIGKTIEVGGKTWKRIITEPPRAQVDSISKINPYSSEEFIKRTANHKGTLGDLYSLSEELSIQREEKDGTDFIGETHDKKKAEKMEARRARNKSKRIKRVNAKTE